MRLSNGVNRLCIGLVILVLVVETGRCACDAGDDVNDGSGCGCSAEGSCAGLGADPTCGDGTCDTGESLSNCFEDCYAKAQRIPTSQCPGEPPIVNDKASEVSARLPPGYPFSDDTIGKLIANQYLWRMPGAEFLAAGFDLVQGGPTLNRVFDYTYCNAASHTYSNLDRSLVYGLPDQLLAVPHPECDYSTATTTFSSAQHMARSMSEETNLAGSLHAHYSGFGYSAGISAAYSQDKSVSAASSASSESTSLLTRTRVHCSISRAALDRHQINFGLEFLQTLAAAQTTDDLVGAISEFGLFHYAQAELGGELSMTTATDTSKIEGASSNEFSNAQSASFSAKASGWGFSASASASYASTKTGSSEQQQQFEAASSHTDILSRGGAAGSFGPSITGSGSTEAPMTWGSWAGTVDLAPWPVKYDLDLTENLFDRTWTYSKCPHDHTKSCTVYDAWKTAGNSYLSMIGDQVPSIGNKFTLEFYWDFTAPTAAIFFVQLMADGKPVGSKHALGGPFSRQLNLTPWVLWNPARGINNPPFLQMEFEERTFEGITGIQITSSEPFPDLNIFDWTLKSPLQQLTWSSAEAMTYPEGSQDTLIGTADACSTTDINLDFWFCHTRVLGEVLKEEADSSPVRPLVQPMVLLAEVETSKGVLTTYKPFNASSLRFNSCKYPDWAYQPVRMTVETVPSADVPLKVYSVKVRLTSEMTAVPLKVSRTTATLPCTEGDMAAPILFSNQRLPLFHENGAATTINFYSGSPGLTDAPSKLKTFAPPPPIPPR